MAIKKPTKETTKETKKSKFPESIRLDSMNDGDEIEGIFISQTEKEIKKKDGSTFEAQEILMVGRDLKRFTFLSPPNLKNLFRKIKPASFMKVIKDGESEYKGKSYPNYKIEFIEN